MIRFVARVCVAVVCFLGCLGISQAQTCITPPSGMVAWYPGDGNANDLLGANNGSPQNGVTFAAGKVGQAFSFNGVNQFVALPANLVMYPVQGSNSVAPLSVDAWFQTTAGGVILGQQGVVAPPATPTGAVPAIYVGTDGMLYVELFWAGMVAPFSSTPRKVNDGVFHHVAVTFDGAMERIYLDGALIGSVSFGMAGYAASYQYQIGAGFTQNWPAGNNGYFYFQGLIDEVEFHTRALTAAEVQAIFTAGSAGKCKTPATGSCIPPPPDMTAWYTADGTPNDFLGARNGGLQNGAGFATGKVGLAFSLNGVNQFVGLPANLLPYPVQGSNSTAPLSVDTWFQTTTGGVILGQQAVVTPPTAPNGAVPAIYVGTDGFLYVELFWGGGVTPISSTPRKVNDGVFHHVGVTFNGTLEQVYLDGVMIGSMSFQQAGYSTSYQYQIGTGFTQNWPAANGGYFYFQGLIDEMEFHSRALSAAEIQSIFNAGGAGKCRTLPPVAKCRNVTVPAGPAGTASASIDDGSFSPIPGSTITLAQNPPGPYSAGNTLVTLTVTDNRSASSQCTGTVTVAAGTASVCGALTATPNVLWPPDNKMAAVTVTVGTSNGCPAATCKIVSVAVNESGRDDGEEDDQPSWVITGPLTVDLLATRSGDGDGRVYTITVQCTDASGAASTKTVTVTVPHDQGKRGDDDEGENDNGQGNGNHNRHK